MTPTSDTTRADVAVVTAAEAALRDALVPYDVLRQRFGISERTLRRWLKADRIESVRFGDGYRAVRWGDILHASARSTRWPL